MLYHQNRLAWLSLALALCLGLSLLLLPATAVTLAAEDETYVVQSGDNLTGIATKYNLTVQAITKANGIVNPSLIYRGQKLIIPKGAASSQPIAAATPTTNEPGYIVQRGDTLYGIAKKFAVSVTELAKLNGLSLMDYIYSGQSLKLPASGGVAQLPESAPAQVPATTAPLVIAPTPTASSAATPTPIVVLPTATASASVSTPGAVIPATPATSNANPSQPTVLSTAAAFGGTYTVQVGDTLSAIAARYGTTSEILAKANNITDLSRISIGQKLTIPGTAPGQLAAPVPTKVANQPVLPPEPAARPATDGKWIDVNLSKQRLVAYVGNEAVFSSLVSTGLRGTPTPVGTFNIYVKYQSQAMSGGSGRSYYYLPGVPYVLYFYEGYALHGTYWHSNFGQPMSHGCVNLPTPAAQFIYNWAPMGTPVKIHY